MLPNSHSFRKVLSCAIWISRRQLALFLNESHHDSHESHADLDNFIIIWWNLVIVRDNSPTFQTTLRGSSDCWVVSNNHEISSNNDKLVQVRMRFSSTMGASFKQLIWIALRAWYHSNAMIRMALSFTPLTLKTPLEKPTHRIMLLLSFVTILQTCW
jgi:hypothetical protein